MERVHSVNEKGTFMAGHIRWLIVIVLLAIFAVWVALPNTSWINVALSCYDGDKEMPQQGIHLDFNDDCREDFMLNVKQSFGLDIIGGLRVLMQADLPAGSFTVENLSEASNNVARRVNALGVGEATVQVQGTNRILVELPGVTNPQEAVEIIQKTALLEFVDFTGLADSQRYVGRRIITDEQVRIEQSRDVVATEATAEATPAGDGTTAAQDTPLLEPGLPNPNTGQPFRTVMTGAGLQAASAGLDEQGRWIIRFELTTAGGQLFGPFTESAINQPMAIVLDGEVLSAPTIQAKLETGGIITGDFTEDEAKTLALQLRSGALPIPLRVISSETVGATLGQESVNLSIRAGIIGVIIILAFMLINYRVPGIAASLALLMFILLNLAVFKLIPVTLTLPAIVGFLISIGSAVDGNILIFERIREELRRGKSIDDAVTEGFALAWSSIRDSNFSTILISGVLFLFGQTPGASVVSGFAVTLALGMMLNLFTAIIVTRTFLNVLIWLLRRPVQERAWLMGI